MGRILRLTFLLCAISAGAAHAAAIRIACYDDGNECEITQKLAADFMKSHPDIAITIDKTPYKAIVESLPVQLASGNGPDIARVTNFGVLAPYFLNLAPLLKDAAYWQANFGPTLDWLRVKPGDTGIYGLPTQMTVTGLIVDKSLFDQAGVPMPGPKATWDDWAAAVDKVAKATNTPYGMAFDRSGHRFAGPAISMGAKYFAPDGTPQVVDAGFKTMAAKFVAWSKNKTIDPDIWDSQASGYRDAFAEFANGKIVAYLSGSWQVHRLETQIGDGFDWKVVPSPCGPAACTGMPGGAAFVAFKSTKSPAAVAAFLDYLASQPVYESWMAQTDNVPAQLGLQKVKIPYVGSPAAVAALQAFSAAATQLVPLAYRLQGYPYNQVLFNISVDRISQVTTGQLTLDEAYQRIDSDVKAQLAAAARK
jgi:alpha-1,4-digalacturonate transport system substrate-binding protein